MTETVLIVDDEPAILRAFSELARDEGYEAITASTAKEAEAALRRQTVDLIMLDLQLPGKSGLDFLRELRAKTGSPPVLVISGQADIPMALEAVRLGAIDFLEKPVPPEKLIASIRAGLAYSSAERQRRLLVDDVDQASRIIGDSPAVQSLLADIERAAPADSTVLITGDNGTGKELVATRLYLLSRRREKPFIRVNCPGIPETLFESELFGHLKGAFTGAVKDHPGKFAQADGGTIFLDEIGDLPMPSQSKLLRVLETGEVETLGAEDRRQVDVRVICATNRDLKKLVADGKFREDLFYRISVLLIQVPLLSERRDDIPLLVGHFLQRFDPSGQTTLSPEAIGYLQGQPFPGNIRQLKNIIERLTIYHQGEQIQLPEVAAQFGQTATTAESNQDEPCSLSDRLRQIEQQYIRDALDACNGNISEAARRLGIDRANLSRKIKDLGLR